MRPAIHRPAVVTVDLEAIKNNVSVVQKSNPNKKVLAVVKANAYGHGAVAVSKASLSAGAAGLCVACLDEGLELTDAGIKPSLLLVLGVTEPIYAPIAANAGITLTAPSVDWLRQVQLVLASQVEKPLPLKVHLALDTGMGRIGLKTEDEIKEAEELCDASERIQLDGVFTHFSTADSKDNSLTIKQYNRFRALVRAFNKRPNWVHCDNSAAGIWHTDLESDAVRLGMALYGLDPSLKVLDFPSDFKPALSFTTEIAHIKQTQAGDTVGYGATYRSEEPEWIATLPIGYADGWLRRFNHVPVIVDGHKCPIVGRICMDQLMIKVPACYPAGQKVTLIGTDHGVTITADDIALATDTIGHEILCGLSGRLPRDYTNS